MKTSQTSFRGFFGPAALIVLFLTHSIASAQYKAPSQYFRKDSPGVNRGGATPGQPGSPGAPAAPGTTAPARPAAPAQPKFKDVAVSGQFYFMVDTNRAFPWTKATASTAKNAQGVTRPINVETPGAAVS